MHPSGGGLDLGGAGASRDARGSSGLGYLILDCRDRLAYGELTSVLLLIGLIGWGLDSALRALGQDGVSSAAY